MGKELNTTVTRNKYIANMTPMLEEFFNADCIITGSGEIAFPATDENGNEFYIKIQISVPRGHRDNEGGYVPYDAYEEAEAYKLEQEEKQAKKEAAKRKKEAAAAEKERKREEKKKEKEAAKLAKDLATKGIKRMMKEG